MFTGFLIQETIDIKFTSCDCLEYFHIFFIEELEPFADPNYEWPLYTHRELIFGISGQEFTRNFDISIE